MNRSDGSELRSGDPSRIGPYRIVSVLGDGGMSVVYLAEQDQPVRRTVALKLIKPGMDVRQFAARFDLERQTLAILEHPNIAKVFDAGAAADGRPYIVMERVQGESITRYCDAHSLGTHARIALFMDVCAAVQHAHQKGIIHRDLKPSNILVADDNGRAVVKVIDFGIAKAIGSDNDATQLTRFGQLIGTPHYMSPEQAELSLFDIDTRTDVYSLGVLLYELLSGQLPIELKHVADYAIGIALREREPVTPSRRVSQLIDELRSTNSPTRDLFELAKTLRGDLDWIVMKAIAKDRARRYQTASEFSADLQRFLSNLPVVARPPSAGYLVGRFVRRNRVVVAAAAIATIALLGGLTAATVGLIRARAAEQQARVDAETAKRVSAFMTDIFGEADPGQARGNTVTAREVLDKAAARLKNELKEEPLIRAALSSTIAEVYLQLGQFSEGLPLAQSALELRRKAKADSILVADSLDQVGRLTTNLNRPVDGEMLHREALELRRAFAPDDRAAIALTMQQIGATLYVESKRSEALDQLLAAKREWDSATNANPVWRAELLKYLGIIYDEQGRFAESIASHRDALSIFKTALGDDHPFVASTLSDLAIALKDIGNYDEAEKAYLEALSRHRKTLGPTHPHVANIFNNLASMQVDIGRGEAALANAKEAVSICRSTLGEEHRQTISMRITMSRAQLLIGQYPDAEKQLREILGVGRRTLGATHQVTARILGLLADVLNKRQNFKEAERVASEARDAMEKAFGVAHWRYAAAEGTLGVALAGLKRFDEAESLLVNSYRQLAKLRGESHVTTLQSLAAVIDFYEASDKPKVAEQYRQIGGKASGKISGAQPR